MNPEQELLDALVAYRAALAAARSAAQVAREALKDEPLANTLKAFSVLEMVALDPSVGPVPYGPDTHLNDAIGQLEARAAAEA